MANWNSLPVELQAQIGTMAAFEHEGGWEGYLAANSNIASPMLKEQLVQLAYLCRLTRAMCSYFTPLLWKHLSYSTEEQLCDKPKLEHVQTLHLALSSEAAHMPALLERVVCFIWMLPALRYAHVSLLLEHVWPEFEPQPVPEPSKRQSTGTRSSTRVVPTKQPNLKSARKAPKREPNWEKLMEQELGTAFDANKTPATWIMQFNARRDPISGRSEAQLPELHSLPKALIKMRQVDVSDGDTILLFNDQIVQLPQPRGLVDPQAVATAESDKVVSSDAMLGCQLPNRLQLDVAVRDLTDGPREFLQSVASNVTHMRIGSAGGRWIDYPKREVDDERQGPLHYHMFTHQRISWPIALNEAGHRFSALTDLSLHVDKQEDLEDLRNLLELFSPTVVNIDVRLESHLLQCLMRLVDDLKSDFYRPELSFPRLKTVTLYYAGPAWEKDNRADDVEAFKYDPYDTLRSLTTRIVGVREESMRSMKAWERLSRKAEGDEELRPLKEDLCAMLAGYWRQRGVEFKLLGVDPLPFTYTWPEVGENAFLQPVYPESGEEGDDDHFPGEDNYSSPGSSEDWEGYTDAGQCSTPDSETDDHNWFYGHFVL